MDACRGPRLFVYDLPARYREDPREAPGIGHVPPGLEYIPNMPPGVRLWHTAEVISAPAPTALNLVHA